jgi:hypothetical protein
MAGGILYMTPKTLKRYNLKWPEVKLFFIGDVFLYPISPKDPPEDTFKALSIIR